MCANTVGGKATADCAEGSWRARRWRGGGVERWRGGGEEGWRGGGEEGTGFGGIQPPASRRRGKTWERSV